jgi:type VI secretion system protein ImpA
MTTKSLETLLQPISASSACGENLSFSVEFDAIRELQREDDPSLDQGEWVQPLKSGDWPAVQAQCEALLIHRSKDLRLVIWLAEAWARHAGFAGLRRGLALCAQVSGQFWEGLHPLPEDGSQEERAGNIHWFLQRIDLLVSLCPLTTGPGGRGGHGLRDWAQAKSHDPAEGPAPAPTQEQFLKALKDTPARHILDAHADLQQCLDTLAQWQRWVDAQLGAEGPSFVNAREALETACHQVRRLGTEVGLWQEEEVASSDSRPSSAASSPLLPAAPAPVAEAHAPSFSSSSAAGLSGMSRGIETPAQALAQLREVAVFFRRTQPHSPVAYLVEKAVRWGEMPLHDWLRAVVKDGGTLAGLEELLGVQTGP